MKNNQLKTIKHIQIKDLDDCTNQQLQKLDEQQLNQVVGGLWVLNWPVSCPGGIVQGLQNGTC